MGLPTPPTPDTAFSHLPSCIEAGLYFLVVSLPCPHALKRPPGTPPMQRASGPGPATRPPGQQKSKSRSGFVQAPTAAHTWYLTPYWNQTARCN